MVSKEEVPEFQGDVECPVVDCDIEGSALYTKDHFHNYHRDYEKQFAVVRFLTSSDEHAKYVEEDDLPETDGGRFLDRKDYASVKSALKHHPVFSKEFVLAMFESINDAVDYATKNLTDDEYSPDLHEYEIIRYKHRKEDKIKSSTHDTYGPNWGKIKWSILERDEFTCRLCNEPAVKPNQICAHNKRLDVHHITPGSEFDSRAEMNDPSNLITLCKSCHGKHEGEHPDATQDEWPDLVTEGEQLVQ